MNRKTLIETTMFLTYALFAMSWVAGTMMNQEIMAFFSINSEASATWATNAITIAKILGNLTAAWLLARLGVKKAFIAASCLIILGAIGAFVDHYFLYIVSRLILGFGGAFIIVYFNPIIVHYFLPEDRPLINGINAAAFNAGNLLAIVLTGALLSLLESWQNVIVFISSLSAIVLILFAYVMEDFSLEDKNSNAMLADQYTLKEGLKDSVNWWLPITYSGLLFCYISIFSFFPRVPTFAADAKHLSSLVICAGMIGTVCGILLTQRVKRYLPIIRYSGLVMTASAALMIYTKSPFLAYTMAFTAGFFMFLPMTALVTLAQSLPNMTTTRVTVIFSMFWSISYGIATILTLIAGILIDMTGSVSIAAQFAVICSVTFFAGSFLLPETQQS